MLYSGSFPVVVSIVPVSLEDLINMTKVKNVPH